MSVKKLGGPLMIADVARQAAANGLAAFLFMMTLVSVNLGLVNLVPLPVLDGGHIATAGVEAVLRKPLSRRAYEAHQCLWFRVSAVLDGLRDHQRHRAEARPRAVSVTLGRPPAGTRARLIGLRGLAGVFVLVIAGAAACRKPIPVDPAEEAFHKAVTQFAEVSKLTQDLTYRDVRFDSVLEALDQIPANADPKPRATALAERIRGARALADAQDRSSAFAQAQAEAPPPFDPQPRMPPPALRSASKPIAQPEPNAPQPGRNEPPSGAPTSKSPVGRRLPSWYASYFGTGDQAQDGGAAKADAEPLPAPDSPTPPPRKRAPPATDPAAPPPVFGVPGPAGSALQGRPGGE